MRQTSHLIENSIKTNAFYKVVDEVSLVLEYILSEGKLSQEARLRLNELTDGETIPRNLINEMFTEAFKHAIHNVLLAATELTEREASLIFLAQQFDLPSTIRRLIIAESDRIVKLRQKFNGSLNAFPTIDPANLTMETGELAYASFRSTFCTYTRARRNQNSAHYARIARGIEFEPCARRSQLVAQDNMYPVEQGQLLITSSRVVFRGSGISVSTQIESLFGTSVFADGIQFSTIDSEAVITHWLKDYSAADHCGMLLSKLINS
ncbi:MAG: hypothetical protein ACK5NT_13970 [Pyrinomonadaceae bacterium]